MPFNDDIQVVSLMWMQYEWGLHGLGGIHQFNSVPLQPVLFYGRSYC